jgi:hypothetical protein
MTATAEVLPSGMRRISSVGYRSMAGAKQLLPANVVFWRGPSLLTGDPILCLAGKHTINAKTGPVIQVYILRADMNPVEAVRTNGDRAICGDCKLRGDAGQDRACYVQWFRSPMNILRSPSLEWSVEQFAEAAAGKHLRLGAYGDPAAVPIHVWTTALLFSAGWTGYTHQWRTCSPFFRTFLMASVDSREEYLEASERGWRSFRVRLESEALMSNEIACPASDEMGHRTTCHKCLLCMGTSKTAKDIAIIAHGQPRSVNVFRRLSSTRAEVLR